MLFDDFEADVWAHDTAATRTPPDHKVHVQHKKARGNSHRATGCFLKLLQLRSLKTSTLKRVQAGPSRLGPPSHEWRARRDKGENDEIS